MSLRGADEKMTNPTAPPKYLAAEARELWRSALADYELGRRLSADNLKSRLHADDMSVYMHLRLEALEMGAEADELWPTRTGR